MDNIYLRVGVKTIINAMGSVTELGGSLMHPEVVDAFAQASRHFIDINILHQASGNYIAKLLNVESAYICSCASAGITLMAAACMTGKDKSKIQKLPQSIEYPNKFIVFHGHRNPFDHAVHVAGGRFQEIPSTPSDLTSAIDDETVAVYYTYAWFVSGAGLSLRETADIAHKHNVFVIVDAAAQLPPASNLTKLHKQGADLIAFSGGKGLCGPQSSGLIIGRKALVEACRLNSSPNVKCIGRGMKVGKEEIIAITRAIEIYLQRNHNTDILAWNRRVDYLINKIKDIPGIHAVRAKHDGIGDKAPFVVLTWDINEIKISMTDFTRQLRNGNPSIAVRHLGFTTPSEIRLFVHTLKDGQELIIAEKIGELFNALI